jgi:hypothetical protein
LSGNECAAPDCKNKFLARDKETVISKICHIEAASENGPRWNSAMTDDQRRHFENLILLCDECHNIIDNKDNEDKYPVRLIKEWKKNHEDFRTYSYLNDRPSLLSTIISRLADMELDDNDNDISDSLTAFKIDEKIKYNNLKRNKSLIDEYKVFYIKINSLYQILEEEGSIKKENLLRNVKKIYLKVKGEYVQDYKNPIEVIQAHADDIFEDVEEILLAEAEKKQDLASEDISFGVTIVMVDAFMRCKILEEPPQV